jgi:MFS family permease
MTALPRALAPLRHGPYRWLAGSLALSLLSTGLWVVAVVWQVVALDGGPAELSLVTALSAGGMLASTLLGGALADRLPQRYILLAVGLTQASRSRWPPSCRCSACSRCGTSPRSPWPAGS